MSSAAAASPRGPLTYVISYTECNTVSDEWAESFPDWRHEHPHT